MHVWHLSFIKQSVNTSNTTSGAVSVFPAVNRGNFFQIGGTFWNYKSIDFCLYMLSIVVFRKKIGIGRSHLQKKNKEIGFAQENFIRCISLYLSVSFNVCFINSYYFCTL